MVKVFLKCWIYSFSKFFSFLLFFSQIEEQLLESLSWKTGSPIYSAIESLGVPRCQEVSSDTGLLTPSLFFMSPTTLRVGKDGNFKLFIFLKKNIIMLFYNIDSDILTCPTGGLNYYRNFLIKRITQDPENIVF